ncbi:hypothetical protein MKEN_01252800 [Mycena kentingensis (nom. inval.)]|nr:hypothetical protein MKEN_01252800 [Mycena kentingensis (nom. inval.)]
MDLDAPLEILPCNAKQPKAVDVMDISDSDDNKWPLPRPTTPPREPSSVIDLSLDTPNNQRPITPPPQRKKEESPILIDLSPARPSTKRKLQSGTQNSPISLISPPRPRPTINRRDPEPPPPPPNRSITDQHDNKLIRIRDSARVRHPGPIEELYKDILDQLRQYAGPYALQTTYKQMELSVGYLAVQLQRPPEYRRWSDYIVAVNHEAGYEWHSEEAGSTRHDFTNDHPYISLEFLLKILRDQGATHILALLPDGRYACDCCMGTNLGIICRHYLIAWSRIPGLPFHISLIRARWLQDTNLDFSAIAPVTRRQQTSQTYSFTAISLPDNRRISNPLSGHPLQNRQTPPPPSQTLNRREIHAQVQANLASLSRGIQTQEQLDDLNAAIQNLQ